jgi:hypothetical protein
MILVRPINTDMLSNRGCVDSAVVKPMPDAMPIFYTGFPVRQAGYSCRDP